MRMAVAPEMSLQTSNPRTVRLGNKSQATAEQLNNQLKEDGDDTSCAIIETKRTGGGILFLFHLVTRVAAAT